MFPELIGKIAFYQNLMHVPYHIREKLISLSQDFQMVQLVHFPTRGQNILDFCFTTHPDTILSCEPTPGLSDHDAVLITFQTSLLVPKQAPRKIYLYKQADWDTIREKLSHLSELYLNTNLHFPCSVNENWSFFCENFLKLLDRHVPTKLIGKRTHLPWLTPALKRLIRKKTSL